MVKEIKRCKKCGKKLLKKNKTGFCRDHIDRSGKNNSFYGKKHTKETIENLKEMHRIKSTEMWKDPEYRGGRDLKKNKVNV